MAEHTSPCQPYQPEGERVDFFAMSAAENMLANDTLPLRPSMGSLQVQSIGQQLKELSEKVEGLSSAVGQLTQTVATTSARLATRISASDHNNLTRLRNSRLWNGYDDLYPLVDCTSNSAIPGFPTTSSEIPGMTGLDLTRFPNTLEMEVPYHIDEKRMAFRVAIGLKRGPA